MLWVSAFNYYKNIKTGRQYAKQSMVKIGIIGGSGLDDPDIMADPKIRDIETVYGKPSSPLKVGAIGGIDVVLLSRHGPKHSIMPTDVPFRANIQALKDEGCTNILATTACGSLKEGIKPGDFVFIDQFIDMTKKRDYTFYDKGRVCHIPMAEPFCEKMRSALAEAGSRLGFGFHKEGTVVTIEGPRFSTRAESKLWRRWKADVINMSTVPEVVLAREAGICYASIAMATDYDCFMEGREVSVDEVLSVFAGNVERVKQLIMAALPLISDDPDCRCRNDYKSSFVG